MQRTRSEDHIDGDAVAAKAELTFRKEPLFQVAVEVLEADAGEGLSGDVEQRDSSMVVTELALSTGNKVKGGFVDNLKIFRDNKKPPADMLKYPKTHTITLEV
ncbi:unnamed protein product [Schistocephalus solidus]|uniref:FRAS1-related extracellular matrix protein 2 n=1 Tax=Schistocephalus solidus TaxID=70667 RepID=A0A183T4M9_SCHSO|nr:unnamed protein product [Schistocephalus solidus]